MVEDNYLIALEGQLPKAISQNELILYFQPKIATKTRKIVGMEALIRWQHPEQGLLSPDLFIPLAEEIGLIRAIGEWTLKEGCRQLKIWYDLGFKDLKMSINVSTYQLQAHNLLDLVDQALSESALPPSALEIEITEYVLMDNAEQTLQLLQALRERGISLAIDDFGTGFSSLSYLKRLPVDAIKIDRSFIHSLSHDQDSRSIVAAIIQLAHDLRLEVVAEGVEDEADFKILEDMACDLIQGYLFSKPLLPSDFLDFLKNANLS